MAKLIEKHVKIFERGGPTFRENRADLDEDDSELLPEPIDKNAKVDSTSTSVVENFFNVNMERIMSGQELLPNLAPFTGQNSSEEPRLRDYEKRAVEKAKMKKRKHADMRLILDSLKS